MTLWILNGNMMEEALQQLETRFYFAALERWGYVLSDVERLVLDADPEADVRADVGADAEKTDRPVTGEQPRAATADRGVEGASERVA